MTSLYESERMYHFVVTNKPWVFSKHGRTIQKAHEKKRKNTTTTQSYNFPSDIHDLTWAHAWAKQYMKRKEVEQIGMHSWEDS